MPSFLLRTPAGARTLDTLIKSQVLYQLSYGCIVFSFAGAKVRRFFVLTKFFRTFFHLSRRIPEKRGVGLLLDGYFVDTFLVASAFKLGCEVLVHDGTGGILRDETAWHDQHVGVVVLTDEVGDFWYPAEAGAY